MPERPAATILFVDDDAGNRQTMGYFLGQAGYHVLEAATGAETLALSRDTSGARPDLVILDVNLPDIDGFEVCRRLRTASRWAPVLIVTARDAVADRVHGLDAGADDYLTKPFSLDELLARLRALMRRRITARPAVLSVGDLCLDPARHVVVRGGSLIDLTPTEFALLEYLMRRPGDVLTRATLVEHVWDFAYDGDPRIVNVYIRALRDKIDRPFLRASLETVRGLGYRIRDDALGQTAD